MHVIEQFIQSKTGNMETCEDTIYVDDNFVCIIDGISSKTDRTWEGKSPGKVAVDCILQSIPYINANATAEKFFVACNETILDWYNKHNVTIEMNYHINHRCGASMIVYSRVKRQIWIIGCGLAIAGDQYLNVPLLIEDICAQVRSIFLQSEIKKGVTEYELSQKDTGREFIKPLLLRQIMFQNSSTPSSFNFYVLDGFFKDPNGIQIIDIPESIKEIVLASDGYPEVFNTLEKTEQFLQLILKDDPLCYKRYKATKGMQAGNISFDDRSYIRVALT